MPLEPIVKPLSRFSRQVFFVLLVLAFVLALPVFIFYATGYRYDFWADSPSITATGGLYVITSAPDATIYVNEAPAPNSRIFRSATYIQGLNAGVHRVHVQVPGTATWVKELHVLPHIVTEVESFNLPLVPRIRPITPYLTAGGLPVVVVASSSTNPFPEATSTIPFVATTTRSTSTLVLNREYTNIAALFTEKASTTRMRELVRERDAEPRYGFATGTVPAVGAAYSAPTTTVILNDVMLYQRGEEIFAKALGEGRDVPVYFCAVTETGTTTTNDTGALTPSSLQSVSTTTGSALEFAPGDVPRECRTDIRIDRKWQSVQDFMFMPGNVNLVLMHLTDGVYVVEVDDRSWQNVQLLYPGTNLVVLVDGDQIYVQDGDNIIEVLTSIATP